MLRFFRQLLDFCVELLHTTSAEQWPCRACGLMGYWGTDELGEQEIFCPSCTAKCYLCAKCDRIYPTYQELVPQRPKPPFTFARLSVCAPHCIPDSNNRKWGWCWCPICGFGREEALRRAQAARTN